MKKNMWAAWLVGICLMALMSWLWLDRCFALPHLGPPTHPLEASQESRQDGSAASLTTGAGATTAQIADLPLPAQAQISAALGRDQSGYHATRQPEGLRMENAGHGLVANFTSAEVEVRAGKAEWRLALRGYGMATSCAWRLKSCRRPPQPTGSNTGAAG